MIHFIGVEKHFGRISSFFTAAIIFGWLSACREKPAPSPPPPRKMSAYMDTCLKYGVPVPPIWGDTAWKRRGGLPKDLSFDTGRAHYDTTEVWIYVTPKGAVPKGVCYALPRITGGVIQLLGIICQGDTLPRRACFWDNKDSAGNPITGANLNGLDPAKIADGNILEENCVKCHRGNNAFVIHPGTALEPPEGVDLHGENDPGWYQPVSRQPAWVNRELDTTKVHLKEGEGVQCLRCHDLPYLGHKTPAPSDTSFCVLLKKAVGKTMPPADPTTGAPAGKWDPRYADDVKELKRFCKTIGVSDAGWNPSP